MKHYLFTLKLLLVATMSQLSLAQTALTSGVYITEIDVNSPDYLEIMNVGSSDLDVTGMQVVISNSYTTISNYNSTTWQLSGTMAGQEVQYKTDGSVNPWGNNMFWNSSSPSWAIIIDDNYEIVDAIFWGWDATSIANFSISIDGHTVTNNGDWTGAGVPVNCSNAKSRIGSTDNNNTNDWVCVSNTLGAINENLTTTISACASKSTRNRFEWIKRVELGSDIDNTSGKNTPAYGDYTSEILEVDTADIVSVTLTPGYKRRAYREYWRIWADWNHDGDFDDAGEKVFEKSGKNVQSGSFTVPMYADTNDLTLRVSMRWKRYAPSCGNFSNGEVEDYTIRVNGGSMILPPPTRMGQEPSYSEENFAEIAEVYANPVRTGNYITGAVRVSELGNKTFFVRNTLGQIVKAEQVDCNEEESEFEISTDGLSSGIYFLSIDSDQEAMKIIIQ